MLSRSTGATGQAAGRQGGAGRARLGRQARRLYLAVRGAGLNARSANALRGRIGDIEELEEFDEFAAAMTVPDQGMNLAAEKVDAGQQAHRAVAFIFKQIGRAHV